MALRKRPIAAAGVAIWLITSALVLASPAGAAPYTTTPTVSVSTTSPCVGCPLTISVAGFDPNEQVNLTLHTVVRSLGSVAADASGAATTTVTLPKIGGPHTIVAVGATSGKTATIAIKIGGPRGSAGGAGAGGTGGGAAAGGRGSGGSGLPSTGVAMIGIGAVGVVLLVGGGLTLLAGRRRRTSS